MKLSLLDEYTPLSGGAASSTVAQVHFSCASDATRTACQRTLSNSFNGCSCWHVEAVR